MNDQIQDPHDEAVMGEMGRDFKPSLLTRLKSLVIPSTKIAMTYAVILMEVIFPDVSFYQKIIDFIKMKAAGAMGVIIRAGQNSWVDAFWFENWSKARVAGLPRGSYWFYDSRKPPKEQAQIWASLLMDDDGEMEHAFDLEENYGGAYTGWQYWYDFLVEFQRLTGLPDDRIAIYTGYYYWLEHGPNPVTEAASNQWFGRFSLWIAWYTDNPANVRIPKPWTSARHWQKGTLAVGAKFGVQTAEIDMNNANMTTAQFIQKYGGDSETGGDAPTKVGTIIYAFGLNFRTGPATSYQDIGDLWAGDKVYGQLDPGTNWIHFNKIVRLGGFIEDIDGWASAFTQYMQLDDYVPPVVEKMQTYLIRVYDDGSYTANA